MKLWFPLHSLLHRTISGDADILLTVQSLEEFVQTATMGEFKKRLQLIVAFHGQFTTAACLNVSASSSAKDNVNILYNITGYYIQYLPMILEHIECSRKSTEKEVQEILKLFHWEKQEHTYLSIENFRRVKHKFWKLIKKFNDALQQPVLVVLKNELLTKRSKFSTWLEQNPCDEFNKQKMDFPFDLNQFDEKERLACYADWKKKLALVQLQLFIDEDKQTLKHLTSWFECENFRSAWDEGWISLEMIGRKACEFAEVWKHGMKNVKRRTLSDLLKMLAEYGLSRHKSMFFKLELENNEIGLFLEPSYDMEHLLLSSGSPFFSSSKCPPNNLQKQSTEDLASKWNLANQNYFGNVAMLKYCQDICLNFHKDLSLEQVNQAKSFLSHLVLIQQEQRSLAYHFSNQLKRLKKQVSSLDHAGDSSLVFNQRTLFNCMWQQKSIFDGLLSLSKDVRLFFHCTKCTHLSSCDSVKFDSNISFIDEFIPRFIESKEWLDGYLLGGNDILVTPAECVPFIISKEMRDDILRNFKIIKDFHEKIQNFSASGISCSHIIATLLTRFESFTNPGISLMNNLQFDVNFEILPPDCMEGGPSLNIQSGKIHAEFDQTLVETSHLVAGVLGKVGYHVKSQSSYSLDIASWKVIFETFITDLQLDHVLCAVNKTVISVGNMLDESVQMESKCLSKIQMHLKHLSHLLDLLITFGDGFLSELLTLHKTVTEICLILAHIFASLFSKGFGDAEEQIDSTDCTKSQDATGTGIGEGEGVNDVSDQIDDESQILGSSDKETQGLDPSHKEPSKDGKGIEMDDDFAAETFSVSEDSDVSDEENDDDNDVNIDSTMGEAGEGNQVQEKLGNRDEDENLETANEKYECGPSVTDRESASREFRAKDETNTGIDDSADLDNHNQQPELSDNEENAGAPGEEDGNSKEFDMNDAFEDPTGIQVDKEKDNDAFNEVDEPQAAEDDNLFDPFIGEEKLNDLNEMIDNDESMEENQDATDMDDGPADSETEIRGDAGGNDEVEMNEDLPDAAKSSEPKAVELDLKTMMGADSMSMPVANNENMTNAVNFSSETSITPSDGLPSDSLSKMEVFLGDSASDSKLASGRAQAPSSEHDISLQRNCPNPHRSMGDALKEWKERVKIAPDLQEVQMDVTDDTENVDADEYRFVSEMENGTAQALGSAMADQMKDKIEHDSHGIDEDHSHSEDIEMTDVVNDNDLKMCKTPFETSIIKHEAGRLGQEPSACSDQSIEVERERDAVVDHAGSFVSFQKDFVRESSGTLMTNEDSSKRMVGMDHLSEDIRNNAIRNWRQYEFVTTKLSQELAEQLRLVLEPTIASKLQGDYRTGKRINMKKVITYIASHFRRDKIWLRRTRPNKRDYQVVIAVDDSRSMSESHCGNFAIEALVTVCRAMSQLEIGQFAVASYGQKGNIRLLHDFDRPFSAEAGAKMISSFTFKQDNTIVDEPMVDLLKYLNSMLDASVAKSRLPSGSNPLQQLILIIADGHFHEKENVKRYIRNVLSSKRMIAFLLLDNPQDSIVTRSEVSFEGGPMSIKRYMDSFPFPYYAVLKNISTLPRMLADLLRQWFELMQNANE